MKLPVLAELNAIGLRGAADRALLAAHWLKTATVSSPAVTIVPEVPAIAARAAVIAQTAKPLRPQSPIVLAANNTTGYGFGELYLNSPAYPAGTQIPAIPQKPASAEVIGVPAVVAVPKVPAVTSPKIDALKGWDDAIQINKSADNIEIIAYLPYSSSPQLLGSDTSSIGAINEMTAPALAPSKWLGTKSSTTPGTETVLPATVERYFYKQALELVAESGSTSTIENSTKLVNGVVTPCKKLTLQLAATNYTLGVENIQLGKVSIEGNSVMLPSDLSGAISRNALYEAYYRANVTTPGFIANLDLLVADPLFEQYVIGGLWLRPYDVSQGGYPNFGTGGSLFEASESEYGTGATVSIITLA
jgi:hypothetical protein